MNVAAGTRFGPYEIVSRIGAGGMGDVTNFLSDLKSSTATD
jgi:hypothetical protein